MLLVIVVLLVVPVVALAVVACWCVAGETDVDAAKEVEMVR